MAPKYDHTGVSDTSIIEERIVMPSTFETIDEAMFQWLDERVNIHCETNKGFKKTQIIWVSAERAYQIKNKKEIRDSSGALILPLITLVDCVGCLTPNFCKLVLVLLSSFISFIHFLQ